MKFNRWQYALFMIPGPLVVSFMIGLLLGFTGKADWMTEADFNSIGTLVFAVMWFFGLALRFRDMGKPAYYCLLLIVPVANWVALFWCLFAPSKQHDTWEGAVIADMYKTT